ncbi:energy transducer TonB, partial [Salinimicrobium oceani]
EQCFSSTLKAKVLREFKLPEAVSEDNYEGELVVLFEVTRDGDFETIYIDAAYPELKEEVNRIFKTLPNISPATYNGRAINMQFRMPVKIPLELNSAGAEISEVIESVSTEVISENSMA